VFYAASSTAPSLTNEDEIVTLADLATPAYKVALDRQSDRQKATVDSLTGLLTPRAFRAELANLISIARAQADARLCLLYIDTDHFKLCNDTLGHAAGDEVLRSLARLFAGLAGPEALVSRNGGDEFCILFHSMTKSDAVRRAERIRGAVEAYPFGRALGTPLPRPLTTSIGVASYPSDASGWEELLERADQAMYHSKRRGRNRVSFFGLAGNAVDFSDGPAATVP
jgi:diguanylate cyclase